MHITRGFSDEFTATRFAHEPRFRATCVTFAAGVITLVLLAAAPARAGNFELRVVDREGHGVADVALVAIAAGGAVSTVQPPVAVNAVMDQHDRKFVPQLLVVQSGTAVAFPNNDTVSHQVYSFSPARRFQLPLYKGESRSPITFDTAGLVVLGCNIHDEMVGYVYVTDSPYFAKTDANGHAEIRGVPAGLYRFEAWGPRVADQPETLARDATLTDAGSTAVEWRLQKPLRSRVSPGPHDVDWDY
jgi:plastocyanin